MSHQLTYVFITPQALFKARTGNILSRLLSRSGLELIGARMFTPSVELREQLSTSLESQPLSANFFKNSLKAPQDQAMVLLFHGEDAVTKMSAIVGNDKKMHGRGETIRDTYGEHFMIQKGEGDQKPGVFYFEPAVIAPATTEEAIAGLNALAAFSDKDGGILDAKATFPDDAVLEKTLVLIKPDNFRFANTRPGGVIDLLARTGLAIVGCKVHRMSVAQAKDFYGPVLEVLEKKLPDGRSHWESIVAFMSGRRPSECPEESHADSGSELCIALIYQGVDAICKIRETLGPTDPSKAPHGTIRKEFGQDIMVNAAHASDAPESVTRETAIININENNFKTVINHHLQK